MTNKDLQLINDEIICHKKAIEDINEKLNLLSFLNGIDNYMVRSFNLNKNELLLKREELEVKLKKLIDQKSELTGDELTEEKLNISARINSIRMSNYLSLHNFEDIELDTNTNSQS